MLFSLLTACPKHHHHHADCNPIKIIHSFKEVDFDQIDANALVIFDVDDVLIFDQIKRLEQRLHVKTQERLRGMFYKKRLPVLVEPNIVNVMKKLKLRGIATIALTGIKTGKSPGLDVSFSDWRIADLKKAGIVFNDPFKKNIVLNQLKDKPLLKAGIIFTAWHDKGDILKKVFSQTGCNFNKIIFFDDKESHVTSVAKAAEDLGVAYTGYIYKGAEFMPKTTLDKRIEEYRLSVLEKDHVWLDQKEAHQRLSVAS
jgi:hypothetical protein